MKVYSYEGGEHRFNEEGEYMGFFDKYGANQGKYGEPFISWKTWNRDKHLFLVEKLHFKFLEN